MKVLATSDDLTSEIWVRDGAFNTAAPDDPLLYWSSEELYEDEPRESGIIQRKYLESLEPETPVVNDIEEYNETVTLKPGSFIEFIVKGKVVSALPSEIIVESDDMDGSIYLPGNYPYKIITAPVEHPPVGTLVKLHIKNDNTDETGTYILSLTDFYHSLGNRDTEYSMIHKSNPDIKSIKYL